MDSMNQLWKQMWDTIQILDSRPTVQCGHHSDGTVIRAVDTRGDSEATLDQLG